LSVKLYPQLLLGVLFLTGLNKAALSASSSTEAELRLPNQTRQRICELVGFGGGDSVRGDNDTTPHKAKSPRA
jgi:hypothetical protein